MIKKICLKGSSTVCLIFSTLTLAITFSACTTKNHASKEWIELFNGRDLTGWTIKIAGHPAGDNYNNTFVVRDSAITVDYSGYDSFNNAFGHLYFKDSFSNYRLQLEYRFVGKQLKGGPGYANLNSGVMLHSQPAASLGQDQSFPVSLEMQFLASSDRDSISQPTGNLCTPGTEVDYNGLPSTVHCINARSGRYPVNEWVSAEAIVWGDSVITHIINGDTVLRYTNARTGGGFVNSSMNWTTGGFNADSTKWIQKDGEALSSGYIALQAESMPVQFRKIKLMKLSR